MLLACVLVAVCSAPAATHTIGPTDPAGIQGAIDAASPGDTIELLDGLYQGAANRDLDFGGKALTLRSKNGVARNCILDCEGLGRGFHFHSGEEAGALVSGLTIRDGLGSISLAAGGAMLIGSAGSPASPTIESCIFEENRAPSGGAVYVTDGSAPSFSGCLFVANEATNGAGGGLACIDGAPLLELCTLAGNSATQGGGALSAGGGALVTVARSILYANSGIGDTGDAAYCHDGGAAALSCSNVYGHAGGDWAGCLASQAGTEGNLAAEPIFCFEFAPDDPYSLHNLSPCADRFGCGLLGARPVSCGPVPAAEMSWGRTKHEFRGPRPAEDAKD
jgi:predicted outer membrane repeat protein